MRLEFFQLDQVCTLCRQIDRNDGILDQVLVSVVFQPGERFRGELDLVNARAGDDDHRVGAVQDWTHDRVHNAGAAVGQHDRVVLCGQRGDRFVVRIAEGLRQVGVRVGGKHVESGFIARDVV